MQIVHPASAKDLAWLSLRSRLASDSPIENVTAHAAHRTRGFKETERVVYFRRAVHGASAGPPIPR
jgi:hypothetical protein